MTNRPSAVRMAAGVILIAIGLVAMPLPVMPGVPIVAAGVALLGVNHPLIQRCRTWIERLRLVSRRNT